MIKTWRTKHSSCFFYLIFWSTIKHKVICSGVFMPKESKVVKEFLDILEKNVKSDRTYYYHQYNAVSIVEFLIGLSSWRRGLLVSDKFWNYYPSWTHDRKVTRRSHFGGISSALAYINNYYPKLDRIIRNKSVGIIACNYLDVHRGKDRICAANRLNRYGRKAHSRMDFWGLCSRFSRLLCDFSGSSVAGLP